MNFYIEENSKGCNWYFKICSSRTKTVYNVIQWRLAYHFWSLCSAHANKQVICSSHLNWTIWKCEGIVRSFEGVAGNESFNAICVPLCRSAIKSRALDLALRDSAIKSRALKITLKKRRPGAWSRLKDYQPLETVPGTLVPRNKQTCNFSVF